MPTLGRRRALGQHFLKDSTVCDKIVESAWQHAVASGSTTLLEIGPGKGALTDLLLDRWAKRGNSALTRFVIEERDPMLNEIWRVRLTSTSAESPTAGAELVEGDFLEVADEAWLPKSGLLTVVSNLPYSAGTAIVTRLARHPEKIAAMVLMFQAEVAHRLRAERSTKPFGSLSVWIQNRWKVEKLIAVPPGAFTPPPDVDSEVVVFTPLEKPYVDVPATAEAERLWESLLKACFAHRRKMLRAGLRGQAPFDQALARSGVDPTLRAEALTWDDWAKLWAGLSTQSPK